VADDPPALDEPPVAGCPPVFWLPLDVPLLQLAIAIANAKHPIRAAIVEKSSLCFACLRPLVRDQSNSSLAGRTPTSIVRLRQANESVRRSACSGPRSVSSGGPPLVRCEIALGHAQHFETNQKLPHGGVAQKRG